MYEKTLATTTRALFYFEDSTVILAFDPKNGVGDILRSDDDGKTWDEVPEVKGKAVSMNEHPFDNQRAIVFTDKKEHWVTKDKGKSWKKFEVELALSLHQSPIAFNSKNSDYALYSGTECDSMRRCRDKVGWECVGG